MTTHSISAVGSAAVHAAVVAVLVITLWSLSAPGMANSRTNLAIDQCIDKATEEYGLERTGAKFWQMNQVGRYVRVWLKLDTEEDGRMKALCKVHKTGKKAVQIKTLSVKNH